MLRSWSEIDTRASKYYEKIIALCKKNRKFADNVTFIVVDHCLQTFESHVNSVAQLGRVAGIILKSSTRVKAAEKYAMDNCNILDVTKEDLKRPQVAVDLVLKITQAHEKVVILDHGGYFSYAIKEMMAHPEVSKRLIGIAEVTENGHVKLQKALKETPMPCLSVARSELKELEDAQTGVSICDATNTILYSVHATLSSMQNVCVIGYGKIGRSIALSCKKRGIPEVTVIEINPLRMQLAMIDGNRVVNGHDAQAKVPALQKAQVLFSATGSQILSAADIPNLRKVNESSGQTNTALFIASCTSPDDEFHESFFTELQARSRNSDEDRRASNDQYNLTPYELFDGRKIYVLNEGKAVNFALGGTPGFEICQVWASVLLTAAKLAAEEVQPSKEVQVLTYQEQLAIGGVTQTAFFSDSFADGNNQAKTAAKKTGHRRSRSASSPVSSDLWAKPTASQQVSLGVAGMATGLSTSDNVSKGNTKASKGNK